MKPIKPSSLPRPKRATCLVSAACVVLSSLAAVATPRPVALPDEDALETRTPGSWTMVVLPDTQYYVDHTRRVPPTPDVFQAMTDWVVEQKTERNIGLVLHVGDIVDNNTDEEWRMAREIMGVLNGEVPYVLATGNHEYTGNARVRETSINQWFKPSDNPFNDPEQGGILQATMEPGRLENAAYEWTAPDGRPFLIMSLEWGVRDRSLEWAKRFLEDGDYEDHTGILVTHAYLYHDNTLYDWAGYGEAQSANPHAYGTAATGDTNDGREVWVNLIKQQALFEMVFCGHVSGKQRERFRTNDAAEIGYRGGLGEAGKTVHEMLFNAQRQGDAGEGWLRLLEFQPDGRTVVVKTYSPWLDQRGLDAWRTDPENYFSIELSPKP